MTPVWLNDMQPLITYMQLGASKAAVHHDSTSLACACGNSCCITVACLHAFCLNTDHALDIRLKLVSYNDSSV